MESAYPDPGLLAQLGWFDLTALAILLVFFVLGLFRGFVWQCSRIATLLLAYVAAGTYGDDIAARMQGWFGDNVSPNLPLYLAYFCVFIVVLVVVSLIALLLEKLVDRSGLSFYNRVGGGLLGVGTGACVVLALLAAVMMFFGASSSVVQAAESSRSMAYSQRALRALGGVVPEPVREVFKVSDKTEKGRENGGSQGSGAPQNGK